MAEYKSRRRMGRFPKHVESLFRLIHTLCPDESPICGAEIGVWKGDTTLALLNEFPNLTMHCVDLWEQHDPDQTLIVSREEQVAARMECQAKLAPCGERAVIHIRPSTDPLGLSVMFTFIDACHLYESVRNDIAAWWPAVLPCGLLIGHDYSGTGDRCRDWGVRRAVDEFAEERKLMVCVKPGNVWCVRKP